MKINIQIKGIREIASRVKVNADRLRNIQAFWRNVGEYMIRRTIKECFDKEQSPDGQKWKPLSPARVKQRKKRHKSGSMKILQDTGELRRSVRYEASGDSVVIGSNLKYSKIHQFGGTIQVSRFGQYKRKGNSYSYTRKVKIPARPFLGVTKKDREHIIFMLATYLNRYVLNGG